MLALDTFRCVMVVKNSFTICQCLNCHQGGTLKQENFSNYHTNRKISVLKFSSVCLLQLEENKQSWRRRSKINISWESFSFLFVFLSFNSQPHWRRVSSPHIHGNNSWLGNYNEFIIELQWEAPLYEMRKFYVHKTVLGFFEWHKLKIEN